MRASPALALARACMCVATLAVVAAAASGAPNDETQANHKGDKGGGASLDERRREAAARFSAAVVEGWERANPPPKVGDRVGPGKGYAGASLPSGATGVVTAPAADGRDGCWQVEWTVPASGSAGGGEGAAATSASTGTTATTTTKTSTHCSGSGKHELAVLTSVPGLPAVDVVERVPIVEWTDDPSKPFAEFAAAMDTPLLFRGTAARRWRASERWQDVDALLANVSTLHGVKVNRGGTEFRYYHRAPMNTEAGMVAKYKRGTFTKHDMSAAEFLRRVRAPADAADLDPADPPPVNDGLAPPHAASLRYSWAGKVDDWGLLRLTEILPLDPFMVLGPGFDPAREHEFRETRVWLSPANTTTPTHYDIQHNCLVQVRGCKRVVLFPPVSWQTLYPWPLLHPGGLSAQVSLSAGLDEQQERFPALRHGRLLAYVAEVGPGEVLYVPPMWFHQVTSLDDVAVSVSVWTPYEGSELYDAAVKAAPLPIKGTWSEERKVAALRLNLESLVRSLDMEGGVDAGEFVRWTLTESRYLHVAAPADAQPPEMYCWNRELEDELLMEAEEFFTKGLRKVVTAFTRIALEAGPDRRDVLLANYIELAVHSIVGTRNTPSFLAAMARC